MKVAGVLVLQEEYTAQEIERNQWFPSRTKFGKFATRESIVSMENKENLKKGLPYMTPDKIKKQGGKDIRWYKGTTIYNVLKKYFPEHINEIKVKK